MLEKEQLTRGLSGLGLVLGLGLGLGHANDLDRHFHDFILVS